MADEEVAGGGTGGGGSAAGGGGGGAGGGSATASTVADRLGVERTHTARTAALVGAIAALLGWYAGWLLADLGLRWLAFLVVAAGAGYRLYRRPTARSVLVGGLYGFAILLLLTPVAIDLTFLLLSEGTEGVGNRWAFVLTVADLVYLVAFAVLAAIPAGLGWLISRRG